jgi:hypothetical protein
MRWHEVKTALEWFGAVAVAALVWMPWSLIIRKFKDAKKRDRSVM